MHNIEYVGGGVGLAGLAGIAHALAGQLRLGPGPRLTIGAACASGLLALIRGCLLIEHGQARRVLVVGTESSLHPLFIGGFGRLGVLPPKGFGCRPFDMDRRGFLVSEAAAAVCLEQSSDHRRLVCVDRFAMGADAFHLTGTDPQGLSLRNVLATVADGREFDLFHAHGTATQINDPVELSAADDLAWAANANTPVIYSHKAALGHSLGAAGLIGVVINAMAHVHGIVPGNVRTTSPLETKYTELPLKAQIKAVGRSLVVTAGFGGHLAAVSLISP
jgi:3-oxoacyl-[acyl-carrier-protein] synthase II